MSDPSRSSDVAHGDPIEAILALENEFIDNNRDPDVEDPTAATEDEIRRGEQYADDDRDPEFEYPFPRLCSKCECKTAFGVDDDGDVRHHHYTFYMPSPTPSETVDQALDLESFVFGSPPQASTPASPSASQQAFDSCSFIQDYPSLATNSEIIEAEGILGLDDD